MTWFSRKKQDTEKEAQAPQKPVPAPAEKKITQKTKNIDTSLLIRPYVTEKSAELASQNAYIFLVRPSANKIMVARAVSAQYGVHPLHVRMLRKSGKQVRWGKGVGTRKQIKKAIVTLPKNEKIQIYEGV